MYLHPHRAKFESCVRLDGSGLIQVKEFLRDITYSFDYNSQHSTIITVQYNLSLQ